MARQRDYHAEYLARNARARDAGFKSYKALRLRGGQSAGTVRNARELHRLPEVAQHMRGLALEVMSAARREAKTPGGRTLAEIARHDRVPISTVRLYAGRAVTRADGEWTARPRDRLYREIAIYSDGRPMLVPVRGSRQASAMGAYHNAVKVFVETGDTSRLERFDGKRVAGHKLITDPAVLADLGERGLLVAGPSGEASEADGLAA